MTLIVLSIVWLGGIYLGTLGALPNEVAGALAVSAAILAALWWPRVPVRLALLAVIVLLAAMARGQAALPAADAHALGAYNDRGPLYLRGVVADTPVPQSRGSELRLAVRELKQRADDPWQPVSGAALVRLPHQPAHRYGDYLELHGALDTPANFDLFPYRDYLARQGITSLVRYPRVMLLAQDQGLPPLALLNDLRTTLATALAQSLPEPQAGLAQGILLGQRAGIPSDLMDAFRRTSTTHIIAISGTNVTLLVALLAIASRLLFGRLSATVFATLGIVAYGLLVGMSPSVVRAMLMGIIFAWGSYFGRQRDASVVLIVAAGLMTLQDPLVLFDLGFQLSFLATAGLVLLATPIQGKLGYLPDWLSGLLAATIAAEATTLPLIVLRSGQLSLVGPVANLVVPPLLPPVMLAGAGTALGGTVWPPLGQLIGYVAWLFLSLMIWSVETLAALPGAALPVGRPGVALVLTYYALLAGYLLHRLAPTTGMHVAWRALWSRMPTVPALAALALAAALSWSAALSVPDDALRISVFDVGQGDAILVRTPQHRILVDGGPSPEAIANALGRRLPFWDRGLDLVVLTHPNEDHLAGLITVLERFPVGRVLETGTGEAGPTYARWRELIKERGIARTVAEVGQEVDLGRGVYLRVLHPSLQGSTLEQINDRSIVLRLTARTFSALLTGDIGPAGAAGLLASGADLPSTVLKVPHHGSRTALGEALLDAASPEVAIVSVGQGNRFGHPAPETLALLLQHGARVYRTDVNGTVEVVVTETGYAVRSER